MLKSNQSNVKRKCMIWIKCTRGEIQENTSQIIIIFSTARINFCTNILIRVFKKPNSERAFVTWRDCQKKTVEPKMVNKGKIISSCICCYLWTVSKSFAWSWHPLHQLINFWGWFICLDIVKCHFGQMFCQWNPIGFIFSWYYHPTLVRKLSLVDVT